MTRKRLQVANRSVKQLLRCIMGLVVFAPYSALKITISKIGPDVCLRDTYVRGNAWVLMMLNISQHSKPSVLKNVRNIWHHIKMYYHKYIKICLQLFFFMSKDKSTSDLRCKVFCCLAPNRAEWTKRWKVCYSKSWGCPTRASEL